MRGTVGQVRRLVRHFFSGLTDNDLIAPGEDLHATIAGVLAVFLVASAGVALMLLGKYNSVEMMLSGRLGPRGIQTLADKLTLALDDKTLLLGLGMIAMALVTVVFWDSLALDERDLAVLGPLPVRPATVLVAKAAAVAAAAVVVAIVLTLPPSMFLPVVVLAKTPVGVETVVRWMLAHATAGLAGCALVFLAISAFRTLAGILLPRRVAHGLLPVVQFGLVLALLALLLSWPMLAVRTRAGIAAESAWLFVIPPVWFLGLEEVLIGRTEPIFAALARVGLSALTVSVVGAGIAQLLTVRLRWHRPATSAGSPTSVVGRLITAFVERVAALVAEDDRARASFLFSARTLTRNPRHRLYLAVSMGLGAAVSCATLALAAGGFRFGREPLDITTTALAAQLNLIFFLVIGIRMSAGVPADLDAGWIFRFHVTPARERYLAGTRGAIFFLFVLPVLVCLAPLHAFLWGWYAAVVHFAFGVVAALTLLEVVFADYRKLPFVSAFTPGRAVLSLRLPLYILGYLVFVGLTPAAAWVLIERTGMAYTWLALFVVVVARLFASQSSRFHHDTMPVFEEQSGDVQLLGLADTSGSKRPAEAEDGGPPPSVRDSLPLLASSQLFGTAARHSPPGTSGHWLAAWRTRGFGGTVGAGADLAAELWRDALFAARRLRANPGFTAFSILTLALGIGVTTSIHSVIYSTVLRPLDVPGLDRLVNIYHGNPFHDGASRHVLALSRPDFEDLRGMQTVFSDVAAHSWFGNVAVVDGIGERVVGESVSGSYFSVLGVQPAMGRLLQPADNDPSAPPVAVIGDRLWRRRFDASPDVIGRSIKIGGHDFQIVGVAPPTFRGVEGQNLAPAVVWVSLNGANLVGLHGNPNDREERGLFVKGRLAPGRTVAQAAAEVTLIAWRLDEAQPIGVGLPRNVRYPGNISRPWTVLPTAKILVTPRGDRKLINLARLTMVAVGMVLLVACSNLANLMLARGATRRRDLAVRLALGASRGQVIREQFVESAILATLGGAAALGVVRLAMVYGQNAVLHYGPWISVDLAPRFDARVVAAALAATFLALVVFGLGPALQLTRVDLRAVLGGASTNGTGLRWRGRRLLIASQVAVSVALVAIASLGLRQMIQAARQDTGLELDRLALVRFDFAAQGWNEDRARRALERLAGEARRQPGIESLSLSSGLPLGGGTRRTVLTTLDSPFGPWGRGQLATLVVATPSVFRTLGIPLVSGRAFDERDTAASTPVVVLSELAALRLFDSKDVVGRQVLRQKTVAGEAEAVVETVIVVGVAADTDSRQAGQRQEGIAYVPFAQQYSPSMTIVARTARNAGGAVTALKNVVSRLEPQLAVLEAGTGLAMAGVESLAIEILVSLAGTLGLVALTLAMVGLYGVLSFVVSARTYELGVRAALGARASQIMRLVMADGILPVVVGVVAGLAVEDLTEMVVRAELGSQLPTLDPLLLVLVPLPFLMAACVACYLPARRAARMDPNAVLRRV
jgi:predicted permease